MTDFTLQAKVAKVDDELGLVMGWAIICKENGEDYFDKQGDNADEQGTVQAAVDFMINSQVAKEMHRGEEAGYSWVFPMTSDIAKAYGITSENHGLMIMMKPNEETLNKFRSGELTGFSIGGERITDVVVEE